MSPPRSVEFPIGEQVRLVCWDVISQWACLAETAGYAQKRRAARRYVAEMAAFEPLFRRPAGSHRAVRQMHGRLMSLFCMPADVL
eukprot:COSAG02_NODE_794_length_17142_cov_13.622367_15_plen_85_part_00